MTMAAGWRTGQGCESSVCWQGKWRVVGQEDTGSRPGRESSGHTGVWPLETPGSYVGWWELTRGMGLSGSWMTRGSLEPLRILSKRVARPSCHFMGITLAALRKSLGALMSWTK